MARKLAVAVHVDHPVTHEPLLLLPGDEPVPEVAEAITNPFAWEPEPDDGPDEDPAEDGQDPEPDKPTVKKAAARPSAK